MAIPLVSSIQFQGPGDHGYGLADMFHLALTLFAYPFPPGIAAPVVLALVFVAILVGALQSKLYSVRLTVVAVVLLLNLLGVVVNRAPFPFATRYADFQMLLVGLCPLILLTCFDKARGSRPLVWASLAIFSAGVVGHSVENLPVLGLLHDSMVATTKILGLYGTGAPSDTVFKSPPSNLRGTLAAMSSVRDPATRSLLPAPVGTAVQSPLSHACEGAARYLPLPLLLIGIGCLTRGLLSRGAR